MVAGLVLFARVAMIGFAVLVVELKTMFGVVAAAWLPLEAFCRTAAVPVLDIPLTRVTMIMAPVGVPATSAKVTVCDTAEASWSAMKQKIRAPEALPPSSDPCSEKVLPPTLLVRVGAKSSVEQLRCTNTTSRSLAAGVNAALVYELTLLVGEVPPPETAKVTAATTYSLAGDFGGFYAKLPWVDSHSEVAGGALLTDQKL
jgi:hypothetical protein